MTVKLKKALGDGGAGLDSSHGSDTLYDLLKELVGNLSEALSARLAAAATGVMAATVIQNPTRLVGLAIRIADAGSAGTTTVQVRVNGQAVGSLSIGNAEANDTYKALELDEALEEGDLVDINVSAAATDGAGLVATARLRPAAVEA